MDKIREKLNKLGLKEKEIAVYLAILTIGRGDISGIAKKAGIKRTSIYQHIEELQKKDFIYKTITKKRIYYSANNPKKIISYLEKEKRDLDYKKNSIKTILPDLENLYLKSFKKPNIVFLEGKSGLWEAYNEIVDTWQNVYQIFSPKNFFKLFSFEENHELLMKLKSREVKLYNLIEKSDKAKERLKKKEYNHFVKSKLLPNDLKFSSDFLVTGDKLVLISFDNLIAVIIKDKAIVDMQRKFFKFVWGRL